MVPSDRTKGSATSGGSPCPTIRFGKTEHPQGTHREPQGLVLSGQTRAARAGPCYGQGMGWELGHPHGRWLRGVPCGGTSRQVPGGLGAPRAIRPRCLIPGDFFFFLSQSIYIFLVSCSPNIYSPLERLKIPPWD